MSLVYLDIHNTELRVITYDDLNFQPEDNNATNLKTPAALAHRLTYK